MCFAVLYSLLLTRVRKQIPEFRPPTEKLVYTIAYIQT